MSVIVRFAPSPTGDIHIGNARIALANWLFTKAHGGRFILRFDDTDRARSSEVYIRNIEEDLAWLGIRPDAVVRQSARLAHYEAAANALREAGRLYPAFETSEELERRRRRARALGRPPIYDRAALKLDAAERADLVAAGRRPHWRFMLANFDDDPARIRRTDIAWDDVARGAEIVDLASLSDPVLIRADGSYLYTLPSIVDDAEMGVTHIIRGEDHIANTGVQLDIFSALGHALPHFAHLNLLTAASGEGLSKRSGALSIRALREAGFEPMAVASLAVLTGSSQTIEGRHDLATLADGFNLARYSRSAAKFDPAELSTINARLVHALPFASVEPRLQAIGIAGGAAFWEAVRANVARLPEAADWWDVVAHRSVQMGPSGPAGAIADPAFFQDAVAVLPAEPWNEATWGGWTAALKRATGRKGRDLFLPLRLALTGRDRGPEMAKLLPLMGREETLARLT